MFDLAFREPQAEPYPVEDDPLSASLEEMTSAELESLAPAWRALAEEGPCAEPFFQPEWFAAFTHTLADRRAATLVTVRAGSQLRGVLPLMRAKKFFGKIPARTLRSLSNVHSCRYDLIHADCDREEVARTAWECLRDRNDWDVIEALDVPPDGGFESLLRYASRDGFHVGRWPTRKMPYLPLSDTPEDPFRNCPERFKGSRSRLKSKRKKLAQEGELKFHVETAAVDSTLESFFALEASGWKGQNGSAIAKSDGLVAFYTRAARAAAERGMLRIYSLTLSGKPIAMHFGLLMNGCYYIPKVAYEEGYRKHSPGLLMVEHVVRDLTAHGARIFDFLGPRMEWKCVWTSHVREHANCYVFRPGVRGTSFYGAAMKLAPLVRRMKYRLRGDPQAV